MNHLHSQDAPLNNGGHSRENGAATREMLEAMIRVDHAGEYGARRIYDGQLAVLRGTPSYPTILAMQEQEREHLETFEQLVRGRQVRPTALMPFWHVGGWLLGAASASLGEKAAMACTVAVESVIGEHYQTQAEQLEDYDEPELQAKVRQFQDDEMEHHQTGLEHGAEHTPGYSLLYHGVRGLTKAAIAVARRL